MVYQFFTKTEKEVFQEWEEGRWLNKVRHSIHAGRDRQFADRSKQQDQSEGKKNRRRLRVVAKWASVGRRGGGEGV